MYEVFLSIHLPVPLPFFQIKRPYFHVKPLDRAQLKAWQSYLDWEIAEAETAAMAAEGTAVEGHEDAKQECVAGHERVLILFERCLIACALYEEFWDKVSGIPIHIFNIIMICFTILPYL